MYIWQGSKITELCFSNVKVSQLSCLYAPYTFFILAETAALISNPCLMREHRCSSYGVQYTCMYSQRVLYCLNVCKEGFCGGGECHAEHLPINNGYEGKAKCRLLLSSLPVKFLFCIFKFDILFNLCYVFYCSFPCFISSFSCCFVF